MWKVQNTALLILLLTASEMTSLISGHFELWKILWMMNRNPSLISKFHSMHGVSQIIGRACVSLDRMFEVQAQISLLFLFSFFYRNRVLFFLWSDNLRNVFLRSSSKLPWPFVHSIIKVFGVHDQWLRVGKQKTEPLAKWLLVFWSPLFSKMHWQLWDLI